MKNRTNMKEYQVIFETCGRRFARIIKDESLKMAQGQAEILFTKVLSVSPTGGNRNV